jgi:polyphosphate kinase 2 (PPK2 family)
VNQIAKQSRKSEETSIPALKRKEYEQKLRELHVELVKLQEWAKREGKKVCVVFEGRDGAGKGGSSRP